MPFIYSLCFFVAVVNRLKRGKKSAKNGIIFGNYER